MNGQPTLITERLILRPYSQTDAKIVQKLIGDRVVADTLISVPYPYPDGLAEEWIGKRKKEFEENKSVQFVITLKEQGSIIGGIGLMMKQELENAELGYWIAKSFWHQGYCTEAANAVVKYGFETLGLNRIVATHMTRNPRSGKVMQKIGMKHEGHLRQAWKRWDKFEDVEMYAVLRGEFDNLPR